MATTKRVLPLSPVTNPPPAKTTRRKASTPGNLYVGKLIGNVLGLAHSALSNNVVSEITTSQLTALWRLRILLNRTIYPGPSDKETKASALSKDAWNFHYPTPNSKSPAMFQDPWEGKKIRADFVEMSYEEYFKAAAPKHLALFQEMRKPAARNDIIIVNKNTSPATTIILQNRPDEMSVEPVPKWGAVHSMGRNNPFMIYGGSEDTITLEISWYSTDENYRDDVLTKCRLLESWTKADGYNAAPPTLNIIWGKTGMFENDQFILTGASYRLTNFQDYAFLPEQGVDNARALRRGEFLDLKLLPNMATQTLQFKRVTIDNRTHQDVISASKLQRTAGVSFINVDTTSLEE